MAIGTSNYSELEDKVWARIEAGKMREKILRHGHNVQIMNSTTKFLHQPANSPPRGLPERASSLPMLREELIAPEIKSIALNETTIRNSLENFNRGYKKTVQEMQNKREGKILKPPIHNHEDAIKSYPNSASNRLNCDVMFAPSRLSTNVELPGPNGNDNRNHNTGSNSSDTTGDNVNGSFEKERENMNRWDCDRVYHFIISIGAASHWKRYAEIFRTDQVDGATLEFYHDIRILIEDYPLMKKGHARVFANAISNLMKVSKIQQIKK